MKKGIVWNVAAALLWVVEFVAEAAVTFLIWKLDMLPTGLFLALAVLLLLVWLLTGTLLLWGRKRRKTKLVYIRQVIACILAAVVIAGCAVLVFALSKVLKTINTITDQKVSTSVIGIYVLTEDPAQSLADAAGYIFAMTDSFNAEGTQFAIEEIQSELGKEIATLSFDSVTDMVDALYEQKAGAIIMDEAYAGILEDSEIYADFADRTRIIYEALPTVQTEPEQNTSGNKNSFWDIFNNKNNENADDVQATAITNTPFVVYLSGSDTRSKILATSRSDVNILAVVNPQTKQVLLVNTPRDYYVPNPAGNGALDKLTHCGIYGIDCSMDALAGLYDVTVDYYAQINFTGFETLIDAIGGVTVYSDTSFVSSGSGYVYQKGYNTMNGQQALAFARERYALASGDNARGIHQMSVIKAVIEKMESGSIITNYSSILDSLEGMFVTDVSSEEISQLVKMQISDMATWNVVSYAVTGAGGSAKTYSMPSQYAYVMYPDEEMVEYGSQLINRVIAGETLTEEDVIFPG